jgi:hypothetical protein
MTVNARTRGSLEQLVVIAQAFPAPKTQYDVTGTAAPVQKNCPTVGQNQVTRKKEAGPNSAEPVIKLAQFD